MISTPSLPFFRPARRVFGSVAVAAGMLLATGCLTKDDVKGLPCSKDSHCGNFYNCELGVCGGPDRDFGGNPCKVGLPTCKDANTINICVGDQAQATDCDEQCLQQGYGVSLGCFVRPSTGSATCECDQTTVACSDNTGATSCSAQGLIQYQCVDGYIDARSCDEVCANQGLVSQGCFDPDDTGPAPQSCQCANTGEACRSGGSYCKNQSTYTYCQDTFSGWTDQPCNDAYCGSGVAVGCTLETSGEFFQCKCLN